MFWLTPGIELNFAYGTCTLLFVLLVLSVRNRKVAARPLPTFYSPSLRAGRRPAPKTKPVDRVRRVTIPVQHSALLLGTGLDNAFREQAKPEAPENSPSDLAAPPELPAVQISDEVQMNSPSLPFEKLDPGAFAGISGFAASAAASTVEGYAPAFPAAPGLAEMEEQSAHENEAATDRPVAVESASETPIVGVGSAMEEALTAPPAAPPAGTTHEKTGTTDVLSFYGMM